MIKIICVGKIKEKYLTELIDDYNKRINKYHKLEIVEILDSNKKEEGIKILSKIKKDDYNIALDLNGESFDSLGFSKFIENNLMYHANLTFIIGGSDGIDEDVLNAVNHKISFSKLTFPHGLFRGILLEQIYRGFKIINNERYHK